MWDIVVWMVVLSLVTFAFISKSDIIPQIAFVATLISLELVLFTQKFVYDLSYGSIYEFLSFPQFCAIIFLNLFILVRLLNFKYLSELNL